MPLMPERMGGNPFAKSTAGRVMGDFSERHQGLEIGKPCQGRQQKRAAMVDFLTHGLVLRRHTAHGIGDRAADKLHPVIGSMAVLSLGKPEFQEGGVEEVPGIIAREGPSRPVGPA